MADREVIAVSFYNDNESIVYMMDKTGQDKSLDGALTGYSHSVFPDEASLLRATFAKMMDYPFLITFNGDDFDLRYLKHRAMRKEIGIKEEEIPIALQRQEASLKHGVHIDLYRFFNNKSIQVYVYNNRYSEHTLNGIAEALLGKEKFSFEGNIAELPLVKLADYCLNDSALTYELTSANDSLLMKTLLVISRIAKMPMNDASRLGVSNWIRSMLFYDHRRIGALIPRSDELRQKGGASSEAIIKGKKYKGGLVIEPKPGIYFGVSVLDFASLYPSIIKVHNLSYETVNCIHEECRTNRVPDTDHWICRKRNGIESLLIGSLRDLQGGALQGARQGQDAPEGEQGPLQHGLAGPKSDPECVLHRRHPGGHSHRDQEHQGLQGGRPSRQRQPGDPRGGGGQGRGGPGLPVRRRHLPLRRQEVRRPHGHPQPQTPDRRQAQILQKRGRVQDGRGGPRPRERRDSETASRRETGLGQFAESRCSRSPRRLARSPASTRPQESA